MLHMVGKAVTLTPCSVPKMSPVVSKPGAAFMRSVRTWHKCLFLESFRIGNLREPEKDRELKWSSLSSDHPPHTAPQLDRQPQHQQFHQVTIRNENLSEGFMVEEERSLCVACCLVHMNMAPGQEATEAILAINMVGRLFCLFVFYV